MKYLILLIILLTNCNSEYEKQRPDYEKLNKEAIKILSKEFVGKCYKDWTGTFHTIENLDNGVYDVCSIVKDCDYIKKDKCIYSKTCNRHTVAWYLLKELREDNIKTISCPNIEEEKK